MGVPVPPADAVGPGVVGGCPKMLGGALVPEDALLELLLKAFPPENAPNPPPPNEDIVVAS